MDQTYKELKKSTKKLKGKAIIREHTEEASLENGERLSKINECFLNFLPDALENINRLTALCGELLGATCALYNRLDQGLLHSWGQWNTPLDYNPIDKPDGHICYDVIKKGTDGVIVFSDLQKSHYVKTDPNVIPYKLKTYIGQAVKFGDTPVGSLCAVFQNDYVPSDSDKKVIGIIASAIGVEEVRKEAEEALRKSEKRYHNLYNLLRLMADNVPDLIWAKDLEGKFTFVNQAMCNKLIMCQSPNQALGKTDMFFAKQEQNAGYKHTFGETCIDSDAIIKERKAPARFMEDGLVRNKYIVLDVHKAPFLDENGEMIGTVGCGRDVTREKETENALRDSEERYALAIKGGKVGVWDWNLKTNEIFIAPILKAMLGYDDYEITNRTEDWVSYIHPADKSKVMKEIRAKIDGEIEEYKVERRMLHKDGSIRWFLATGKVQRDVDGTAIRFIGTDTDITERKQAEENLRKAHDELELKVINRTAELLKANEQLKHEIEERKQVESVLKERRKELENKTHELEEVNAALKVLLKHRDEDKKELEEKVIANVKKLVLPYVKKLHNSRLTDRQMVYLNIIESNLEDIITPFLNQLSSKYSNLTPNEIQVAGLVRDGKTTKEIADLLNSSTGAINFHRNNIRKKLGLRNKKTNLRSLLLSLT